MIIVYRRVKLATAEAAVTKLELELSGLTSLASIIITSIKIYRVTINDCAFFLLG